MTQRPEDESSPRASAPDAGPLVPPDDWTVAPGVGPATLSSVPPPQFGAPAGATDGGRGSRREQLPSFEGLAFDRARELNSRAVIGMVLSGIAVVSVLAWFAGAPTPLLLAVAAAIGGTVMGLRGWSAARQGLASNGGLGLAAAAVGVLALTGVVVIYALVIAAIGQLTG